MAKHKKFEIQGLFFYLNPKDDYLRIYTPLQTHDKEIAKLDWSKVNELKKFLDELLESGVMP